MPPITQVMNNASDEEALSRLNARAEYATDAKIANLFLDVIPDNESSA